MSLNDSSTYSLVIAIYYSRKFVRPEVEEIGLLNPVHPTVWSIILTRQVGVMNGTGRGLIGAALS